VSLDFKLETVSLQLAGNSQEETLVILHSIQQDQWSVIDRESLNSPKWTFPLTPDLHSTQLKRAEQALLTTPSRSQHLATPLCLPNIPSALKNNDFAFHNFRLLH
jgi:hypothetical protein